VDVYRFGGNGDGTLFYPGTPRWIGGKTQIPIESLRLKMIRDGLEDYEYLALLARRAGAGRVRTIAEQLAPGLEHWNHSPEALYAARAEIAREIESATTNG